MFNVIVFSLLLTKHRNLLRNIILWRGFRRGGGMRINFVPLSFETHHLWSFRRLTSNGWRWRGALMGGLRCRWLLKQLRNSGNALGDVVSLPPMEKPKGDKVNSKYIFLHLRQRMFGVCVYLLLFFKSLIRPSACRCPTMLMTSVLPSLNRRNTYQVRSPKKEGNSQKLSAILHLF